MMYDSDGSMGFYRSADSDLLDIAFTCLENEEGRVHVMCTHLPSFEHKQRSIAEIVAELRELADWLDNSDGLTV